MYRGKEDREGDVGIRLLKRSEMMGNYISNYRWEQEQTRLLWCAGKFIKSAEINVQEVISRFCAFRRCLFA